MEKKIELSKILIVTRYFFPTNSADSVSVYNMCKNFLLISPETEIHIITTIGKYKIENQLLKLESNVIDRLKIHKIRSIPLVKNEFINFLFGLVEALRLLLYANKLRCDKLIFLTSPPLIAIFFNFFMSKKNLYYWAFDIYPDAFIADGLLKPNNLLYKSLKFMAYKKAPKNIIALGEAQFKYLSKKFNSNTIKKIILPCGIHDNSEYSCIPKWYTNEEIIIGYIGNIGRAHNVEFLMNFMSVINNNIKFKLVLSIYGYHSEKIKHHFSTLNSNNIFFIQPLLQKELKYINIHLVSLNEDWTNISVPSKAVSAICSESPIWFCGSYSSDTYLMFKDCCYYSDDRVDSIKLVLETLSKNQLKEKSNQAKKIAKFLLDLEIIAYEKILE